MTVKSQTFTRFAASTVDGRSWTSRPEIANSSIEGGNARVMAFNPSSGLLRSLDGQEFHAISPPPDSGSAHALAFAAGQFILTRTFFASTEGDKPCGFRRWSRLLRP